MLLPSLVSSVSSYITIEPNPVNSRLVVDDEVCSFPFPAFKSSQLIASFLHDSLLGLPLGQKRAPSALSSPTRTPCRSSLDAGPTALAGSCRSLPFPPPRTPRLERASCTQATENRACCYWSGTYRPRDRRRRGLDRRME
jgi:hypothetical protein